MRGTEYTAEDHKLAYQIWKQWGNFSKVSREVGCTPVTATNWARADFCCPVGCQWHGWEEMRKYEAAQASRDVSLTSTSPEPPKPTSLALYTDEPVSVKDEILANTRPDLNRLAELEYLYSKIYHDITGLPINCPSLPKDSPEELEMKYRLGRKSHNLEGAVRTLLVVFDKIQSIKEKAGVYEAETKESKEDKQVKDISYEEAKELQKLSTKYPELAEKFSPEKLLELVRSGKN